MEMLQRLINCCIIIIIITDPVLAVLRSTFCIGRHGSGFPSRLSLAAETNMFHSFNATHKDTSFVANTENIQQ